MKKQLNILIPYQILSLRDLTPSDKLIYGFHYCLKGKKGYLEYTNIEISKKLNIHFNKVGRSHKELVEKGFLNKEKRRFSINNKYMEIKTSLNDKRDILLPFEVYSSNNILSGSKLLWGEYNSISKGEIKYFMRRSKTSLRIGVSEQSITNWTKELDDNGFLKMYNNIYGYNTTQRIVITKTFIRTDINNEFDEKEEYGPL